MLAICSVDLSAKFKTWAYKQQRFVHYIVQVITRKACDSLNNIKTIYDEGVLAKGLSDTCDEARDGGI